MVAIERFQAETFAKPTTDGALAARRHLGKPVILYLISHLAVSRRRSILGFRLPYDLVCKQRIIRPYAGAA